MESVVRCPYDEMAILLDENEVLRRGIQDWDLPEPDVEWGTHRHWHVETVQHHLGEVEEPPPWR